MKQSRTDGEEAEESSRTSFNTCKIQSPDSQEQGQALIIALAFIVLFTVLAVAFLTNVTTAGVGENASASETSASQLAQTAVQMVEGTITNATAAGTNPTVAWASQPGMIRTYGTPGGGASSTPLAYYKLYSSNNMVVSNASGAADMSPQDIFGGDVPPSWNSDPALFTDLNSPITLPVASSAASSATSALIFPIVDPRASDPDIAVQGFSYSANMTGSGGSTYQLFPTSYVPGTSTTYATDTTSRLPMPVRWMYVLRDGSVTVPDRGVNSTATWSAAAGTNVPTKANPIVGRVGFWTDDECGKININTASEGTYWDTPITNSSSIVPITSGTQPLGDDNLAAYEPAQHEYQRYPGHPATTCLSTVFGQALTLSGLSHPQIVQAITDAIPRVSDYLTANSYSPVNSTVGGSQVVTGTNALVTDEDRLYANVDEFQFNPSRGLQNLGTTGQTEQNIVDTCRFFMTAHSKAPELNMFGLPRVSIWPLWDPGANKTMTSFDNEMLRCSTLNVSGTDNNPPHQMCFFRSDPTSSTNDFLKTQKVGGQTRNQEVFSYLQALTAMEVPGYGNNMTFLAKYPTPHGGTVTDRDQILAEIFDYIRSTNLADNSANATPYTSGSKQTVGSAPNQAGLGQVVPIQIPITASTSAHGFGRFPIIGELGLLLIKVDDRLDPTLVESGSNRVQTVNVINGGNITSVNPKTQTLLEWVLIPDFVCPMAGYVPMAMNCRVHFSNISLNLGGTIVTTSTVSDIYSTGLLGDGGHRESEMGGSIGLDQMITSPGAPAASYWPTGLALVSGTRGTPMTLSGSCTVTMYAPAGTGTSAANQVQQYNFNFPTSPATQVFVPSLATDVANSSGTTNHWYGTFRAPNSSYVANKAAQTGVFTYPSAVNKSAGMDRPGHAFMVRSNTDVFRSLTAGGTIITGSNLAYDTRLVGLSGTVPSSAFTLTLTGSGNRPTALTYLVDSMRFGTRYADFAGGNNNPAISGCNWGTLLSGTPSSAYSSFPPQVPPQASGSVPATGPFPGTGDWDNGPGVMMDGPWINKPDEGMSNGAINVSSPGSLPYIGDYNISNANGAGFVTNFSPNRQISSPVMFGSLPVGPDHPWRTLLFRPANLPGLNGGYTHPGNSNPASILPDHLLLDLFWMPVVEPYGISEPFATSGKINLNTQIAPFTYITRQTGLEAVLKSVMITALNPNLPVGSGNTVFIQSYHNALLQGGAGTKNPSAYSRIPIDCDATVAQLTGSDSTNAYPEFGRATHSLANPNFFVSPTQICDLPLVPLNPATGAPYTTAPYTPSALTNALSTFWSKNNLTGDNSLERPYSLIYPRVTTKSNIFTVHVIAQALKQTPSDVTQGVWTENTDAVTSEFRGSFTVEKYFDPNMSDLSYYSGGSLAPVPTSSDGQIKTSYPSAGLRGAKWRLLSVKRFGQ